MKSKLKELRQARGLTLRELDEQVNINYSQLARIERGESTLSHQHIKVLTKFFNVSADYLLGMPEKAIPLSSGIFKPVPIRGSVYAGFPTDAEEEDLGFLMAKVDNVDNYFYLEVKGDSMSPTFEHGDYVLVDHKQKNYNNNQIVVAGLNGSEATVKRYRVIGEDRFLFADNESYAPIKLKEEQQPYIVGVVTGFYRNEIK